MVLSQKARVGEQGIGRGHLLGSDSTVVRDSDSGISTPGFKTWLLDRLSGAHL